MDRNHMKRFSLSLGISELQIKISMQYHFVPTKMTVIKKMEDLSELLYQNSIDRVICTHDVLFLTAVDTRKFENKDPADSVSSGVLCSYVVPSHLGLTMWKGKGSSLQTLLQRH
jgi:hypothetical protein